MATVTIQLFMNAEIKKSTTARQLIIQQYVYMPPALFLNYFIFRNIFMYFESLDPKRLTYQVRAQ